MAGDTTKASKKRMIDTLVEREKKLEVIVLTRQRELQVLQQQKREMDLKVNQALTTLFKGKERLDEVKTILEELGIDKSNPEDRDTLED